MKNKLNNLQHGLQLNGSIKCAEASWMGNVHFISTTEFQPRPSLGFFCHPGKRRKLQTHNTYNTHTHTHTHAVIRTMSPVHWFKHGGATVNSRHDSKVLGAFFNLFCMLPPTGPHDHTVRLSLSSSTFKWHFLSIFAVRCAATSCGSSEC